MKVSYWVLLGLAVFLFIEVIGFAFPYAGDFTCPECGGKGQIYNQGIPDLGIAGYWTICPKCGGTGRIWVYSKQYAAAVASLLSSLCFIGLFTLEYAFDAFRAGMNEYVDDVEHMGWLFNPMYSAWLLRKDKLKWTQLYTAISAAAGLIFGVLLTVIMNSSLTIAYSDFAFGVVASVAFMPIAAACWYMGICKPWTKTADQDTDEQELTDGESPD
jgi:hypothetical protein